MDARETLQLARRHQDSDPDLAVFIVRDLPETEAAGLHDLAWTMQRRDSYVHRNDAKFLLDELETYLTEVGRMNDPLIFGCKHCAGTGYEDYPTCSVPCRMSSHKQRGDGFAVAGRALLELSRRDWCSSDGACPYCRANSECKHWTGLGWSKR
jgi:hypothetical protein